MMLIIPSIRILIKYNVYNNSRVDFFTGFLFGMKREIQQYQHSKNNLFQLIE